MGTEAQVRDTQLSLEKYPWYGPATAYILGVIFVLFFTLLSGAIDQSSDLINISGETITSVRMASIGLGAGYYFGSSLKHRDSGKSWFLFGVFSVLTIFAFMTDSVIIFDQYPAFTLLITGAILTTVAQVTPLVAKNESYQSLLKYLSGYLSTGILVFLATSNYLVTFTTNSWAWFQSLSNDGQGLIAACFVGAVLLSYGMLSAISQSRIQKKARQETAEIILNGSNDERLSKLSVKDEEEREEIVDELIEENEPNNE